MTAPWMEGTVASQTRWSDRLLSLKVDAPAVAFEAGQFARLALDIGGERMMSRDSGHGRMHAHGPSPDTMVLGLDVKTLLAARPRT